MCSYRAFHELSLHCISAQEHSIEHRSSLTLQEGEHHKFCFVQKGAVQVTVGEQRERVSRATVGEVVHVPPEGLCSIRNTGQATAQLLLIHFQCANTAWRSLDDARLIQFRLPHVHYWVRDFLQADATQDPALYFHVQAHLYAIAAECMEASRRKKGRDDDLIDYVIRVKQKMTELGEEQIDIEETARLSGASTTRFYQMFKRYTGFSPLRYMTMVRLNESLRLLANQPGSIKEVAYQVGYADELYFSRLFRKQMGLTPTEYMARTKRRVASLSPVLRGDLAVLGITPVLELPRGWHEGAELERSLREIERCRPDLIITSPVPESVCQALRQIAPVQMIHWKGTPWKSRLLSIGNLFDIASVAERWLDWFHQKAENARQLLHDQYGAEPFLLVSLGQPFFRVHGLQRLKYADLFYQELQVTPPHAVETVGFLDVKSLDDVAAFDFDHVILLAPSSLPEECCSDLEGSNKHCILLRHEQPLYNAIFYQFLLDEIVEHVLVSKK